MFRPKSIFFQFEKSDGIQLWFWELVWRHFRLVYF